MLAAIKEAAAALSAIVAYVLTVLPRARQELRKWQPLPPSKVKNAEAVAVLATLAPRSTRAAVVRAIVRLQVAIDCRDMIEEEGGEPDPSSLRLEKLEAEWRRAAASLPSYSAVAPLLQRAVTRCEEGQRHTHAAAAGDPEGLQRWADGLEAPAGYRWWELAAGASSSVAAHALLAIAAGPPAEAAAAAAVDAAYFPPIGALTVFLDDLVDRAGDEAAGEHNYLSYYGSAEEAADRLSLIAGRAEARLTRLSRRNRHRAILAGVAAYYLSDRETEGAAAAAIYERLLRSLGPGARLLSSFMRVRRIGERKRPG